MLQIIFMHSLETSIENIKLLLPEPNTVDSQYYLFPTYEMPSGDERPESLNSISVRFQKAADGQSWEYLDIVR